jgi:hypothetical protein
MSDTHDLTERLAESVYGEDGLLVKQARIEVILERIDTATAETNAQVKRINGTVADYTRYRDALPEPERSALVRAIRTHINDAEEVANRAVTRKRSFSAYAARFGYDALKLGLALLVAFVALHIGLPAEIIRGALGL